MAVSRLTKFLGGNTVYPSTWTRPADWLAMPTVNVGDQKVVLLYHILDGQSGSFGFTINGAYTVDWGDGSAAANFASGVQASKTIASSALSSSTLTSDGYRQGIVTITPQAANSLTTVNLAVTPSGTSGGYAQQWRDIKMAGASVASFGFAQQNILNMARWFTYVGPSALTSLLQSFRLGAPQLRGITGTQWTSGVQSFASMLNGCINLETVPLFDTSAATDMSTMFNGCTRLATVPLFNTASVTTMAQMFNGCPSLTTVPLFNTANVTTMGSMFSGCSSLTSVPLFDTSKVTTMGSMFNACSSLTSLPNFNYALVTDTSVMCSGCVSLVNIPASISLPNATVTNSMFNTCTSLTSATVDAPKTTNLTSMFQTCTSLTSCTVTNSSLATTAASMFASCPSLQSFSVNLTGITSTVGVTSLFNGTLSLSSVVMTGLKFAPPSFSGQQMQAAALDAMYTSLGTASGAQAVNVTSNPGIATDTPTIATAKGWTVTGT